MKSYFPIILILVLGVLATSCSNSNLVVSNSIIQKRKHTKGFFLNIKKPQHHQVATAETSEIKAKIEPQEASATEDFMPIKLTSTKIEPSAVSSTTAASKLNSVKEILRHARS